MTSIITNNNSQPDNTLIFKRRPRRVRSTGSRGINFPALPMEDNSLRVEDAFTGEEDPGRLSSSSRLGYSDSLSHLDLSASAHKGGQDSLDLSNDGSQRFRFQRRRMDQQLYLADKSTRSLECSRMSLHGITERPDEESSGIEEDTPKVLVFRRPKRSTERRSSTWY